MKYLVSRDISVRNIQSVGIFQYNYSVKNAQSIGIFQENEFDGGCIENSGGGDSFFWRWNLIMRCLIGDDSSATEYSRLWSRRQGSYFKHLLSAIFSTDDTSHVPIS